MKKTSLLIAVFIFSIDLMAQWKQVNIPASSGGCFLAGNGPDVFAVISENSGAATSLYISTDYGATWSADTGFVNNYIYSLTVIDSNVFAATYHGIFESSDTGKAWEAINGGVMETTYSQYLIQSGSNLIAISHTQVKGAYLSSDNGSSWVATGSNFPPYNSSLAAIGSNIFASFLEAGVYISTDHGLTWTVANDTLWGISNFAVIDSNLFADRSNWAPFPPDTFPSYNGGVFRSSDNGKSWIQLTSGLPEYPFAGPIVVYGPDIFVDIALSGFYFSGDNGNSWNRIVGSTDLSASATSLYVNDSSIFAGTYGNGTWKLPLSEIVTSVKRLPTSTTPTAFRLDQNYPNPFNPMTVISYQLVGNGMVNLDVYDILGRKIQTLVSEHENAGPHSVTFNANNLASGVYFYRLRAGSFVQTKKLILIK